MKVAIISDIHENMHNLILALKEIEKKKAKRIIFLGDFINNGIAMVLADSKLPVYAIWGNNDGDKCAITKTALGSNSNLTVADNVYDFLEIDGRKIFITHYTDLAKPMAKSGEFDAVFYGHNHVKNMDKIGKCIIVNPGEVSATKTGKATFALYDTTTNKAEIIELKGTVTTKTDDVDKYRKPAGMKLIPTKSHKY